MPTTPADEIAGQALAAEMQRLRTRLTEAETKQAAAESNVSALLLLIGVVLFCVLVDRCGAYIAIG